MKRMLCLLLCLLMISTCALADQRVYKKGEIVDFGPEEQLLEVYVCPLLAADAMILRCGGEVMAVDVGKYNHNVEIMDVMNQIGETHFTRIFNTHPHDDHCVGMMKLVEEPVTIDRYMTAFPLDYAVKGSVQNQMLKVVRDAGIAIQQVQDGDIFYLGAAKFTCMQRFFNDGNINNSSCVLLVEYGQTSLLLTGDIDVAGEIMLVKDHPWLGKVDIMKAPHHGVAYLKADFMNVVDPEYVFITNGSGSSGPSREWLDKHKIPYVYSSRGPITLRSNGDHWIVEQDLYEQFKNIK